MKCECRFFFTNMFFNGDSLQVYNESLLVTLTVQRYAHALLHGTPVEKVPELFK